MHRFLNRHIYDLEVQDCLQEGIETIDINYTDNQLIIDTFLNVNLISKKIFLLHYKILLLETLWHIIYP
jgi:hypothetical protein